MDAELTFWILFFVGGYCLVLAFLLRVAFRTRPDDRGEGSERSGASA